MMRTRRSFKQEESNHRIVQRASAVLSPEQLQSLSSFQSSAGKRETTLVSMLHIFPTNPRKRRTVIYSALRDAPVPKANQLDEVLVASSTSNFTLVMPALTISSRSAAACDKSIIRP